MWLLCTIVSNNSSWQIRDTTNKDGKARRNFESRKEPTRKTHARHQERHRKFEKQNARSIRKDQKRINDDHGRILFHTQFFASFRLYQLKRNYEMWHWT